jgi:YbbR domain-containing protein
VSSSLSEARGGWTTRAVALLVAILLWFFIAFEKREAMSEKVIEAGVTYNTPRDFIVLDPIERVKLRLRGPTSRIRNLNPFLVDVLVAPEVSSPGAIDFRLRPENVVMPERIEVVSIEPSVLRVEVDRGATAILAVRPQLAGEPAAGAAVGEPRVTPDRALVRGPESRLHRLDHLLTTAVSLDGHAIDFSEPAGVVSPDPLITVLEPSLVTVFVPLRLPSADDTDAGGGEAGL